MNTITSVETGRDLSPRHLWIRFPNEYKEGAVAKYQKILQRQILATFAIKNSQLAEAS
jgi:hypothetical protein